MRRREFITLVGGAAAWPMVARAQQGVPIVGILSTGSREDEMTSISAFTRGLRQAGYVEGQNVAFEYRLANDRFDRLPSLAADLVRHNVTVIYTMNGTIAALAAKAATQTIPIVFSTGGDPVKAGLVASINRPGGNITGINNIARSLNEKRLEMLHEVLPKAGTIALIYNPNNPNHTLEVRSLEAAARVRKLRLHPLEASNDSDIELASRKLKTQRPDALLVMTDPFLNSRVNNFVALSTSHNLPTIYGFREFVVAGGLMSYGTSNLDARRQAGLLVARILQGEKPSDLPVWQSIKIELVLNLKIAKELGLTMPITLLGRADEVIE